MTHGRVLAEGKTKILYEIEDELHGGWSVALYQKDVVTWNNQFNAPMPGKGAWSTRTNAALCGILQMKELPHCSISFLEILDSQTTRAAYCLMAPFEVVVRDVVDEKSSYLKRHPETAAGVRFDTPRVEFFLKTHGKEFAGTLLPDDDPYISRITREGVWVHHPGKPVAGEGVFISREALGLGAWDDCVSLLQSMERHARDAFTVLRDAWKLLSFDLRDMKIEFGWDLRGMLSIADTIDNDSIRIRDADDNERSKQNIRDGKPIAEAAKDYAFIADKSEELHELLQSRFWRKYE